MLRRLIAAMLTMATLLLLGSVIVHAEDEADLPSIEVVATAELPEREMYPRMLVQATSWSGGPQVYILTITNLSDWQMPALRVIDRYIPADVDREEEIYDWFPEPLQPGNAVAKAIPLLEPDADSCHQIEISLRDGLGIVLMDCSAPGSSTIWDVGLTEEMISYLDQKPLTQPEPSGPSKIGVHVTRNSSATIMEFVKAAQPAVVVAVGDLGWLTEVKKASPATVTLGRLIEGDQSFEGDPQERARDFVQANLSTYAANTGVDYWLGWNEPGIDELWQMEWYASFESERIIAMAEHGFKVATGNFSVGTPEAEEFKAFLPAVAVAKDYGAILAVHEYSAPTLLDGVGAAIPGFQGGEGFGALTLRYRYWYEHLLRPHDLVIPLVVTEAGIDGGVLRLGSASLLGWRDFAVDERLPEAIIVERQESYLEQLSWYDDRLRCDPYVLGFAIFNVGDDDGEWESFDITSLLPDLAGLAQTKN
ncbi:MAG: hypothetical protein JXA74_08980 [Anaerolineae bacterium]|nr:hypothetical protein [Anaerolineae bacterium]